ncbi:Sodium/calcium exchanger protein [Ceratobasidium sp. AG-Ba]|nr:Sodium/calcium exchanger protein [Ceratobasidium sp. AG-Ba]
MALELVASTSVPDMYRTTSTAPLFAQRRPTAPPTGWWRSLWWRLQGGGRPVPGIWDSCVAIATSSWLNVLLVNVPLAWTAALMKLNPLLVFGLSFLAIVPLEKMSEFAGNQFALYCGETLGDFVKITLANVVEVNLAMFLLFECQLRLVQSTVIGKRHTIACPFRPRHLLLTGGARVLEQRLKPVHTQLNASLLFLGVVTLLVPVAFFSAYPNPTHLAVANTNRTSSPNVLASGHTSHSARAILPLPPALHFVPDPISPPNHKSLGLRDHKRREAALAIDQDANLESTDGVRERNPERADEEYMLESARTVAVSDDTRQAVETFSRGYAVMLMIIYILSRVYLHRHPLNDDLRLNRQSDIECYEPEKAIPTDTRKRKLRLVGPGPVIVLLIVVVGLIAVTAEFLVESIEHVQQVNRLSSEWFGLILLPLLSYSADGLVTAVYCCRKAWRRRSLASPQYAQPPGQNDGLEEPDELAEGRSIDLSIQFLLFWLPLLVIIAWITRKPLTLLFDVFEVASAIGACLLVNYATQDGKTNWVEGIILVVFYVMIALAAWFYNGQLAVFELLQCQSIDDIVKTNSVLGAKVGI